MLQTLVTAASYIQTFVSYAFYLSFTTGKFLVTSLCVLSEKIVFFCRSIASFVGVLFESLSIFVQDVSQGVQQTAAIITQAFDTTLKSVSTAVSSVAEAVYSVYMAFVALRDAIYLILTSVLTCIEHSIVFVKKLIVLFGSGIWFSVTLIPFSIVYFFDACITLLKKLIEETVDIIWGGLTSLGLLAKNFYYFMTDIPVESAAGLLIAASFVYIFIKFYMIIFSSVSSYLYHRYLYLKHKIAFVCERVFSREPTEERVISPLQRRGAIRRRDDARRPFIERRQVRTESRTSRSEKTTYDLPEDRCCVICQERLKCVVLLPCKHLCLCSTCVQRLKRYDDKCPVCRNNIDSEMRIYI